MKNSSLIYTCSHCDAQSLKWSGRCLECEKWGTLEESIKEDNTHKTKVNIKLAMEPKLLSEIGENIQSRINTDLPEFDHVLGGGIVPGSLILLGGDPGIGKSTLSLQILQGMEPSSLPLYISGEESGQQIKLRSDRLGIKSDQIQFLPETSVEKIIATITRSKPSLVIVDSIQTIYSSAVESEPGSVNQVRVSTVRLLETAKSNNIPIILIGHVTKDGHVAGPKTLEHLVDTVLYLEGDRYHTFRILRTVKNRFGPTNEVGVFEMTSKGLHPVKNPSALFISAKQDLPGSVITCITEGSRPFLVEIQALVTKSVYASPQRRASGFDLNRLQLLLAVLQQRTKHSFSSKDVHLNVVGGMKIQDPSTDLAVCYALISALQEKSLEPKTIILGEVGLAGEIRPIRLLDDRLKEAHKLGYKKALIPKQKTKALLEIKTVESISEV